MYAPSSAVAMKINCDVLLTIMVISRPPPWGKSGNGYETAKSKHIFATSVNATANLEHYQK